MIPPDTRPDEAPPPSPRRVRLRSIGLRGLLILVAIVAIGLGWLAARIRAQRDLLAEIRARGGMYHYDYEVNGTNWPKNPRSNVPRWLLDTFGVDAFHRVTWLRIEDPAFNDRNLARVITTLPDLQNIAFVGTAITDEGLRVFRDRPALVALWLDQNKIHDVGLDAIDLSTLPNLELISVRSTGVSDAAAGEVEQKLIAAAPPGARRGSRLVFRGHIGEIRYLKKGDREKYERTIAEEAEKQADPSAGATVAGRPVSGK